jgi:hypothetical protein
MAQPLGRTTNRARSLPAALAGLGARPGGRRHPLVAAAMVLPLAALLAVAFGGVEAVITQASSVAGLLGR